MYFGAVKLPIFLNLLEEWMINKCIEGAFNYTVVDILFGNAAFDDIVNRLLVLGKQFINKMKMEQSEPSLVCFKNVVWKHYRAEKYIAVQSQVLEGFSQKLYKYRSILYEMLYGWFRMFNRKYFKGFMSR